MQGKLLPLALDTLDEVNVWFDSLSICPAMHVGALHRTHSRIGQAINFEYTANWLGQVPPAFPLDEQLPLYGGRHIAHSGAANIPLSMEDCSPDRWGKLLMNRREAIMANKEQRKPRQLRAWDYLLGVNDLSRMGALRFIDPASARYLDDSDMSAPPMTDLRTLEAHAERIEKAPDSDLDDDTRWIAQLIAPGSTLGGARPKASFSNVDGTLWMAKFPSTEDIIDVGLWESITHELALRAGITMPEAKLLKLSERGHTFATKRFDRHGKDRIHYASAKTLLNAAEGDNASYLDLAEAIKRTGTSGTIAGNLEQLFKRVVFNVLVGNRDDHLRNHGFLRRGNGWELSPAFDVNPNPHKDIHVLALDAADPTPDTRLAASTHKHYGLSKTEAGHIVEHVRTALANWKMLAQQQGARRGEIAAMEAVIDPAR